jgi:hypothetical protein
VGAALRLYNEDPRQLELELFGIISGITKKKKRQSEIDLLYE